MNRWLHVIKILNTTPTNSREGQEIEFSLKIRHSMKESSITITNFKPESPQII